MSTERRTENIVPTLIGRPELAARWSMHTRKLTRLEAAPPPGFPAPLRIGRLIYFRVAEVEAFERSLTNIRAAA